tara:strand:+ start:3943 stop:5190 length:1248 start_codon:yes stop_codon:yes gene_type:complete
MTEFIDTELLGIGLALGLGLLIGIEREWEDKKPLGLRTFALLSVAGATSAVLAAQYSALIVVGTLLAATALLFRVLRQWTRDTDRSSGATTVIAALVTFLIGAMAASGMWVESVVLTGATMLLLHWKRPLHQWIDTLGAQDFEIIARFTLIAMIVLPLLPNRTFGPYDVFNPFQSWLFVVLIVGINIVGYILFRFTSKSSGLWLAGLLGGLISSTATTISYANISKHQKHFGTAAALVIIVASTVVYGRVLIELLVVAPELVRHAVAPMAIYSVILTLMAVFISRHITGGDVEMPEQKNPAQFGMAVGVAVAYVIILFAVAMTKDMIGGQAIYLVAFISGLTDVDALTLSVGQHFSEGHLPADTSWRAIFLATLSNLAFKTGAAALLGSTLLRKWILGCGLSALIMGLGLLAVWP